ncbi:extracellular solute-binding protein [Paenibacillus nasutitermitis]|uniref:HTH gntR-type domain-containing protein n=1 Tax=Paenibacillus nasutitermitis TaxID=1652958 RepID=A0A917DXX4_9BACL|nr:extracellular solute-binding protein [Paenibacillus nasutitermitis]GGD80705.1 hypothetical protein GCM10010911_43550 [Paenibacillus nasutitermitis]
MKRNAGYCYTELADVLRAQIKSGFIRPGDYLLPENDLSSKYGISRSSVRRALLELQNEQLIIKHPGKGTMVTYSSDTSPNDHNELLIVCPSPSLFCTQMLPVLIPIFEERCPHVKIRVFSISYRDSLLEELSHLGVKPDLVVVSDQQFSMMHPDDFLAIPPSIVQQTNIPEPVYKAFLSHDTLLAAPVTYSPVFLAYQKHLFHRHHVALPHPGWTTEQFIETAKQLTLDTNQDGIIDLFGIALSSATTRWPLFALKKGADVITSDAEESSFHNWVQALTFMRDLIYLHKTVPIFPIHDMFLIQQLFDEERIAMMLTSLLAPARITGLTPYEIAPFPSEFDQGGMLIANGLMIARNASHPALAQLFVEVCMTSEVQAQMIQGSRFLSVYDSVNQTNWRKQDLLSLGVLPEQIVYSKVVGGLFTPGTRISELEAQMKKYWSGMEQPVDLVHRLHHR